jgi:hypothetical protein
VGASEEGELHLVMDANVSKPIQCLLIFLSYFFFFQENSWGTLSWHFTEMRRLARDESHYPGVVTS